MESKLNYKAIETYAKSYSSKLGVKLFDNKEFISGEEILQLPVSQVGKLILNNIYQAWALEAEKLKSPYFNYDNEAVKSSLQKLMNVLSKNIIVSRNDFIPILSDAVYDTLLLLISPFSYYKSLLKKEDTSIETLQALAKFVTINSGVLSKIISALNKSAELLNEPNDLLTEVFNSMEESPESNDEHLKKFTELHPLTETNFYLITDEENLTHTHEFGDDDEVEGLEETLNDSFVNESYETVADTIKDSQEPATLKSMLSINQKFMFINDLFNDSQEDFTKVLDFLESCETKDAAVSFIHNNYLKHNIWKANAPQVKEFMLLIDQKFGN